MAKMKITKAEIELCFERFLIDARDDFFPDPIRYRDLRLVRTELVNAAITNLGQILKQNKIKYPKEEFHDWDVPKSNYVVRHGLTLHPTDVIVYHFMLNRLLPKIEPTLSKAKYSAQVKNPKTKNIFRRPTENWIQFKEDVKDFFVKNPEYKYLVSTDIAGFYEYIHIVDFKKQMQYLMNGKEDPIINLLNKFLRCFSVSSSNDSGIPQNYDPSSYLCSAFLDFLDKELESNGYTHFRHGDDIKIPCKTKNNAREVIVLVIRSLRTKNLNLSTAKTQIWQKTDPEFAKFTKDFPPILKEIDKAVEKKRKDLIQSRLPVLIDLTKKVIRERRDFDEKLFRACIWRIVKAHYFKNVGQFRLDGIGKKCIHLMEEMPESTDIFLSFLVLHKNKKYVHDGLHKILLNCVYPWQEMKILELLIQADTIKNNQIIALAKHRVRTPNYPDPSRNYAIVFLGKHGDYQDKQYIASLFSQTQSFLTKRCIILALQEYQDRSIVYNIITAGRDDITLVSLIQYVKQLSTPQYVDENKNIGSDLAFLS